MKFLRDVAGRSHAWKPQGVSRQRDCCRRLARTATGVTARQTFLNLADTWERLASELENAQAFLKTMEEIEPPTPFDGPKRLKRRDRPLDA
jgi:hypothetical protein